MLEPASCLIRLGVPFEKRIGRMLEALRLCKALWRNDPVDWSGRWSASDANLRPKPVQEGGPPIWGGGSAPASLVRAGKYFDGWMPTGPADPRIWAERWKTVTEAASKAGRDPTALVGALYLTVTVAENFENGEDRLMAYLRSYYGPVAERMRAGEACYGGPIEELDVWLQGFIDQGVSHMILRFAGDHDTQMEAVARCRREKGW